MNGELGRFGVRADPKMQVYSMPTQRMCVWGVMLWSEQGRGEGHLREVEDGWGAFWARCHARVSDIVAPRLYGYACVNHKNSRVKSLPVRVNHINHKMGRVNHINHKMGRVSHKMCRVNHINHSAGVG